MAERGKSSAGKKFIWYEFDCSECTAHNPWDDGFTFGSEVFCNWCGCRLEVRRVKDDDGDDRFRLVLD